MQAMRGLPANLPTFRVGVPHFFVRNLFGLPGRGGKTTGEHRIPSGVAPICKRDSGDQIAPKKQSKNQEDHREGGLTIS